MSVIDRERLPQHVGIIMDGNGRWAKQRGLKRTQGTGKGLVCFAGFVSMPMISASVILPFTLFPRKTGRAAGRGLRYYGALT